MELDVLAFEELVVRGVRRRLCLFEAGVLGDHRLGVRAVSSSVLGFLADERVGFLGDIGVGDAGHRLARGGDDVALERDGQEREGVAEQSEARVGRLPLERDRLVDAEIGPPDREARHISQRYIWCARM